MTGLIILVIIIVIALLLLTSCIKIVPQAKALVIERLGAYQATWSVDFILNCRSLNVWQEE